VPLSMLLEMSADAWPDRDALGTRDGRMTYGQLRAAATSGAHALLETGARSVAYLGLNGPDFAVALWSAALAGLPFCPLSYRMSGEQLRPLLARLDAPLVLTTPAYEPLAGGAPARRLSLDALTAARRHHGEGDPLPAVADDATAVLLFTSGTTSAPKAVVLTHENLVSYVIETVEFGSAGSDDAILVTMPPYHVAGVNAALTNPFAGRRIVYLPNFDPAAWLATARAEAVTHAMVVPTMLARIVDELGGKPASLPALRVLSYGGARMPRAVLERALAAFPDAGFVNAYGLTETSSTIAVLSPEDHRAALGSADPAVRARLSSAGRLVPGVTAEVRDATGTVLAPGTVGEIWLRGRQISGRYLGQGSALDEAGWFPTRDRGHLDADGYLYISGRADDTIIRGGENIAPAEIEEVLATHEAIADAAVVGQADEEWGERIVAVVVPRRDAALQAEDVRGFVRARLRGSRVPDDVVFVSELPYTPTGKLIRRELGAVLAAVERRAAG
jgi:acyl-CoA synthetase (AMP-forming)/AMP-acid ligase II